MIARAVATMGSFSFINCSSSLLMNKYRGDSEKMVHLVFQVARERSPSILFFDEVDALMSARSSQGEEESFRRFKSQLLSEIDGVDSGGGESQSSSHSGQVIVLAASNFPWDLDEAFRRRFEKRILIPLPSHKDILSLLLLHLSPLLQHQEYEEEEEDDVESMLSSIIPSLPHFSSADVKSLCKEIAMAPIRRLLDFSSPLQLQALHDQGGLVIPPITRRDVEEGVKSVTSSVDPSSLPKFEQFESQFGSS